MNEIQSVIGYFSVPQSCQLLSDNNQDSKGISSEELSETSNQASKPDSSDSEEQMPLCCPGQNNATHADKEANYIKHTENDEPHGATVDDNIPENTCTSPLVNIADDIGMKVTKSGVFEKHTVCELHEESTKVQSSETYLDKPISRSDILAADPVTTFMLLRSSKKKSSSRCCSELSTACETQQIAPISNNKQVYMAESKGSVILYNIYRLIIEHLSKTFPKYLCVCDFCACLDVSNS